MLEKVPPPPFMSSVGDIFFILRLFYFPKNAGHFKEIYIYKSIKWWPV